MKRSLLLSAIALFALACVGPRGPAGPQGPTGMTGPQGPPGLTGSQGVSGPSRSADLGSTSWVLLRDIVFDFDRADLRTSEMAKIADIATYAKQNPGVRLGIDSATDPLSSSNNVALGRQRIASVRDALLRTGVSPSQIDTGDFASERPKCDDSIERCSPRDGHVEVLARSNS